ncbi:hypothetical protein [Endozoicomonas elysicola]|uniref:Uncharacterized protein n=1 Tax=Endozoicomonas elysicola TaxID=305900 RepID=A0A081K8X1_9GAMM|nr:hypothetical protein [Endozoicomonas elysicola]KEI70597.1 hypothetical protein GV64_07455 [Endozoicomonas elysicola]
MEASFSGSSRTAFDSYLDCSGDIDTGQKRRSPKKGSPYKKNVSPKKNITNDENSPVKSKSLDSRQMQTVSPKKLVFSKSTAQPVSEGVNPIDRFSSMSRFAMSAEVASDAALPVMGLKPGNQPISPETRVEELPGPSQRPRKKSHQSRLLMKEKECTGPWVKSAMRRSADSSGASFHEMLSLRPKTGAKRQLDFGGSLTNQTEPIVKRPATDSSPYKGTEAKIVKLFNLESVFEKNYSKINDLDIELQSTMYDKQTTRKLKLSDINASFDSDHDISRIKLLSSGEAIDFPFFSIVDTPGKTRSHIISTFPREMYSIDYHEIINTINLGESQPVPCECIKYTDGRHLIGQPAKRSCVASCEAMVLMDLGKGGLVDVDKIRQTNISTIDALKQDLEQAGLHCVMLNLPKDRYADTSEREKLVRRALEMLAGSGDAVVSVCAEIGSHVVMLDGLSEADDSGVGSRKPFVHIRDPFNKLRLKVDADYFFKISSSALVIHRPAS